MLRRAPWHPCMQLSCQAGRTTDSGSMRDWHVQPARCLQPARSQFSATYLTCTGAATAVLESGRTIPPMPQQSAGHCIEPYESLTGRSAGELLRERLCLGRFRGGENCLPRKASFPLLRLRLGLWLLEGLLLVVCLFPSPRSLLPLPFRSLLVDLLLLRLSGWLLLLSFSLGISRCLAGDLSLEATL